MQVNISAIFSGAILYPSAYEANYCDGVCGDPENNTSLYLTSHARFQYYYLSIALKPSPPVPRCVPSSYSTVAMLMSEGGNTVLRIFDDLSASSCQCL